MKQSRDRSRLLPAILRLCSPVLNSTTPHPHPHSCASTPSFTFFLGRAARHRFHPDPGASQQGCSQVCPVQHHRLYPVQLGDGHSERLDGDGHNLEGCILATLAATQPTQNLQSWVSFPLIFAISKMQKLIQKCDQW